MICRQTVSLKVSGSCADWTQLLWGAPILFNGTFTPDSAASESFACAIGAGPAQSDNYATLTYNGSGCNCNLHLEWTGPASGSPACSIYVDYQGGASILCWNTSFFPVGPGTYDVTFSLPDTGGADKVIEVGITPLASVGPYSLSGTFSNV